MHFYYKLQITNYKFFKAALTKSFSLILILSVVFLPRNSVSAATLNAGTNITVCTSGTNQPGYTTQSNPDVTFYWTFSSSQSDYNDGVAPPTDPTPSLSPSTQNSFWIDISPNANFSAPLYSSGWVVSAATTYNTSTPSLAFATTYYWRLQVKDSYDSITDWVEGGSFRTNKPSINIKGGVRLKGGTYLK